jgi:tripartite ATP-independent transporter DctM subunit
MVRKGQLAAIEGNAQTLLNNEVGYWRYDMDLTNLGMAGNFLFIIVILFAVLGAGLWISFGLALTGLLALIFLAGGMQVMMGSILYQSIDNFVLSAIPLFIFLAHFIMKSGLSKDMYEGVSKWTSILPGRLVQSNIIASAIFAAVCGSSSATAATIGTVAYHDQIARGYDPNTVIGTIAAGGTLGILIPPSLIMIVYGDFVGLSVGRLFLAGVIPGILVAIMFMIYVAIHNCFKSVGPPRERLNRDYFKSAWLGLKMVWPILLVIGAIMVGIYGGWMTPTEAAAFSSFVAMLIAVCKKKFSFSIVWESAAASLRTGCMILFITVGAMILGQGVSMIKLPSELTLWFAGLGLGKMQIWIGVIIFYIILGCLMEGISMMLLTLPVMYPLLVGVLGFDGVWFGIQLVILIECAQLTPPVGMNLFILQGITKKDIGAVSIASFPYFIILLLSLVLLTIYPEIILFLPNRMF